MNRSTINTTKATQANTGFEEVTTEAITGVEEETRPITEVEG